MSAKNPTPGAANRMGRMAYLGTLAGGLAHEVRNPLSTMKVNLQLLREDLEKDAPKSGARSSAGERAARRVEVLEKAVTRLEDIVNDFLKLARGFDLHPEPGDLNAIVDDVVSFVEPETRKCGVGMRTAYDKSLGSVRVDRKYVQQALLNLLLNARQAIQESGKHGEIFVTTKKRDAHAVISVTDTGPGISAEALPRIFEAYYSTKKGGTGLGLPTARRIVEEHGGRLTVSSEPGKGTSFTISLPLDPPTRENPATA